MSKSIDVPIQMLSFLPAGGQQRSSHHGFGCTNQVSYRCFATPSHSCAIRTRRFRRCCGRFRDAASVFGRGRSWWCRCRWRCCVSQPRRRGALRIIVASPDSACYAVADKTNAIADPCPTSARCQQRCWRRQRSQRCVSEQCNHVVVVFVASSASQQSGVR